MPSSTSPYYTYNGSLTTSPFSDRLTWIVFKPTLTMSAAQVLRYADLFKEPNARPLQSLRGRAIYERISSNP
jgi:carbonic anhydrase